MIKGHVYKGKPKPLTKAQRKLLTTTKWGDLQKVFRGPGWTQKWLQAEQRKAREEFAEQHTVDQEIIKRQATRAAKDAQRILDEALSRNEIYAEQIRIMKELRFAKPVKPIEAKRGPKSQTEIVPIALYSDIHPGERVIASKVGGRNEYSEDIARSRVAAWARNVVNMINLYRRIRSIRTLVLPVLGDLMTGNIHPENAIDTWCPPMAEAQFSQGLLVRAIEYILEHGDLERLVIPTCVGNHARITKKPYMQSEVENSIESMIYSGVAQTFVNDTRVDVILPEAYLSYIDVLGKTVAYHHGHAVHYQGGIGGLAVPLLRYIHRQSSNRRADLYVCGHFHQSLDLGKAVVNGSMIGFNAFALKAGFEYEKPQQSMILIDAKYGRGPVLPIWVDE